MNYSRVALLLALVLVSRTADAWVIDSQLMATGERTAMAPLPSTEDFRQAGTFQLAVYWPVNDGTSADRPNVQAAEKLGIDRQLALFFHRGMSLLKTNARRTVAYASQCWQQAVAYCRDHSPKAEKVGLDVRARFDDFAGTMSNKSPVENQHLVCGGLSYVDLVECLYAGSWPNHGNSEQWCCISENKHPNWTNDEQLPAVRSMATQVVRWAERLLEDWKGAFRNTSHRFAQLNWTILFRGQTGDRTAGNTTAAPR